MARAIVYRLLNWAEKHQLSYASERETTFQALTSLVTTFIELLSGHDVDSEVREKILAERRRRSMDWILKKH